MSKIKSTLAEKAEMLHHISRLSELFYRVYGKKKNSVQDTSDNVSLKNEKIEFCQKIAITGSLLALFSAGILVAVKIYKMGVYKQKWGDYDDYGYS